MNPIAWAAAVAAVVAALGGVYLAGYRAGGADCRERVAEINAQAQADALETARRVDRLHVEIEALRAKPERVRTVVKEVKVEADATCVSLPDSFRWLWNAVPRAAADSGTAAVGDGRVSGLADPAGNGQGRD
ncbi:MAG: hypothetical protein AB7N70_13840 [Dehalococcoidia bacterium]